jgi:hypothetical protein
MEFNQTTLGTIYCMYHNENNPASSLFKKGVILSFLNQSHKLFKGKNFINSNFEWESNERKDLIKFNDISLLNIQKIINHSRLDFTEKCGGSEINAYGLIKIWIKIMQEDEQLKGDLNNALNKDYVFPLNPNMQRHINEVEEEISNNPLARIFLS